VYRVEALIVRENEKNIRFRGGFGGVEALGGTRDEAYGEQSPQGSVAERQQHGVISGKEL
jgi:hypothetical protein